MTFITVYIMILLLFFRKGDTKMRSSRLESGFQDRVKRDLERMLPGCMILKQEAFQGIPDLLVLYGDRWFALECKRSQKEAHQPNQDYYVDLMDRMSYARFIYPENKEEIFDEIFRSFQA